MQLRNKILASALKIIANVIIVIALALLTLASYQKYRATGSLNWLGLMFVNGVFVAMYAARRDATNITQSPALWLLAFVGTCVPLALRPTALSPWAGAGDTLQLAGICSILVSMLSLQRSFGIVPAHRGIRTQGLYNIVRHPLYASELVWMLGFAIANPSAWNIGLWLFDCMLLFTRACAEERFLGVDPLYSQYQARVKYRLVPLVF